MPHILNARTSALALAAALTAPLAPALATTYTFTTLNVPGAAATDTVVASGINNAGQIVGTLNTTTPFMFGNAEGFLFDPRSGAYTLLAEPDAGSGQNSYTFAAGINNSGQIVGSYFSVTAKSFLSYIRNPATGAFTSFSPLGQSTSAAGINDKGQIVGVQTFSRYSTGFLLDAATGQYTVPPAFGLQVAPFQLPHDPALQPQGINNAGDVVGGGNVLYNLTTATSTTLAYPGSLATYASGINNTGQIVGKFSTKNSNASTGFLLDEATGIYSSIIEPDGTSTSVNGINDVGQIVGSYVDSNGNTKAFLATPISPTSVLEPTSLTLLGTTVLGLGWIRRQRSQPG